MKRRTLFVCRVFPFVLILAPPVLAQSTLARNVIGNGGGETSGTNHTSIGTLGQTCIGVIAGPANTHEIGFWYPTERPEAAVEEVEDRHPSAFSLGASFPNPSKSTSTLLFSVPTPAHVVITLYDVAGRAVRTLVDAPLGPGYHRVVLDAVGIPGGIYFVRMSGPGFVKTRRLMLLR